MHLCGCKVWGNRNGFIIRLRGLAALLNYTVHRTHSYGCCVKTVLLYCAWKIQFSLLREDVQWCSAQKINRDCCVVSNKIAWRSNTTQIIHTIRLPRESWHQRTVINKLKVCRHTSATGRSRVERIETDSLKTNGISLGSDRQGAQSDKMATQNRRTRWDSGNRFWVPNPTELMTVVVMVMLLLMSYLWLTDWLTEWLTDGLTDWLPDWRIDWLTDGLTDWLPDGLTDWLPDWRIDWLTAWLTDWLTDWQIYWLTDWLTDCLTDGLTDWRIDWLTDWRIDWLTDWLTDGLTDWRIDWLAAWLTDWLTDCPVCFIHLWFHFVYLTTDSQTVCIT
jgi:hypothetical protein